MARPSPCAAPVTSATRPESVLATLERWERAGGTHASVYTMDQHFETATQHVDYLAGLRRCLQS